MDYKFIQPVSMQVTEEQHERDLREPLLAMGYEEKEITNWDKNLFLATFGGVSNPFITNIKNGRGFVIPEYNPKLFLAIAAITDKETPIVGEWLVCIDNSLLFDYKIGQVVQNKNPKLQLGHYHRRATLQELIEKFTNKETIKENTMKIEVIKPQEEVKWSFPCKGKYIGTDLVVGFSELGIGVVLNTGRSRGRYLYEFSRYWSMNQFEPIVEKEKGNNYDWSNAKFPILVKGMGEDIFTIDGFDEVDNSVTITTFSFSGKIHYWCEERAKFSSEEGRNKWLKSLEILPKGTEIKITF